MKENLAIIDGKSVFYRAYYAMRNLSLPDGTPSGAVYGFATMLIEIIEKLEPEYIAVAWDKSKTNIAKRKAIYNEYKANRAPSPEDFRVQIPLLRKLLDAWHIPLYEYDNYEADDIIGTLAKDAANQGLHVNIISGDLDMLQIVDHDITMHRLKKGFSNVEQFNIPEIEAKYNLKKEQFLDLKSLKGDSSDNIPGVPGVGEKTAIKLLNTYQTLDNIYEHLNKITPDSLRNKLISGKESAYISKQLAEIMFDAPVKFNKDETNFRLCNANLVIAKFQEYHFNSLIERFSKKISPILSVNKSLPETSTETHQILELQQTTSIVKVPQNLFLSYDVKAAMHTDKKLAQTIVDKKTTFWDIGQADFILDPLNAKKHQLSLLEDVNLKDIYQEQQIKLQNNPKLKNIIEKFDLPLIPVLYKMEEQGIKINSEKFAVLQEEFTKEISTIEQEIYKEVGHEFNINSPLQLSQVLFDELKLPTKGIKKTSRHFSTGAKELEKLRDKSPIIEKIERLREITKLVSTYITPLPSLADAKQRIHTTFTQNVTATGRLSSINPNLQNIPTRSEDGKRIRECFVAEAGKVFVSADYAQFELRLAAALSNDEGLIEDFNSGLDIHTKTASDCFHVPMDQVTKNQRRAAKVINFGVLYGMSAKGLSEAADMTLQEAKIFIENYFTTRYKINNYLNSILQQAKNEGYVETLFGRRRPTPDIHSPNFQVRNAAERAAKNMPIQGTEADLMKLAMIAVDQALPQNANLILQIHDSLIVECDKDQAGKVKTILKDKMENVYPKLPVKLAVDVTSGNNWSEL
ncbi:hypothetical protein IIY59_02855 [Candidatus Saccharibacteria bacterium]|nr:hypothetical protein [Candidatus Saccharibacteria bacterium]